MELHDLITKITPANEKAYDACIYHFDHIAKPVGSLGKLETLLAKVAGASGTPKIDLSKKCVLVFCADNGVLAQGVAQSIHDVTTAIANSLVRHTTSVNTMAAACGADVFPVDMGMIDQVDGLIPHSIARGTNDISEGPAMTLEQAKQAILTGIHLVKERKEEGYRIIATGEAGIGNTTTSSAILSVLLDVPVEKVTGRGSGLTDDGLLRKQNAIKKALEVNKPDASDALDVLAKVGGFDIAGMTGAFLGGAIYGIPVIMDGFISGVAALLAVKLCPYVKDYILPSHISAEPAGQMLMEALGLDPIIHANMRLGEGTGAVALMPLLDMAAAVYWNAASFDDINVEAYEKWTSN
ncbi:MAG: nicotinate-nucleotide--dimethylbenzimidazole phosphoribosyltransferase [Lachnospiraceae bacterium]|nr:nicotinate-nucleotide--dimethylbenzimidazole phosphoribosyltransferase [Lachnospiraceae bacterium]